MLNFQSELPALNPLLVAIERRESLDEEAIAVESSSCNF